MTIQIHHATVKAARQYDIIFEITDGVVHAIQDGVTVAEGATAKIALEAYIAQVLDETADDEESEDGEGDDAGYGTMDDGDTVENGEAGGDDEAEEESRSIVKSKYKKAYVPFKQTCGDDMSQQISKAVRVTVDVVTKSGKTKKALRIDRVKLKRLARVNGVWDDRYDNLNVGQARMNIGNRLRKLAKDGTEIKWV